MNQATFFNHLPITRPPLAPQTARPSSLFLRFRFAKNALSSPNLQTQVRYAHSSGPTPIRKLFTQLAPYVRPYRWMAFALLFSLVFESGLETATRFSFRYLIDEAVTPRNYKRLMELLGLLGSAALYSLPSPSSPTTSGPNSALAS